MVAADGDVGLGSPFARAFAAKMPTPGLRLDDAFAQVRQQVETETNHRQRPEPAQNDLDVPLVLMEVSSAPTAALPAPAPYLREAAEIWPAIRVC
jgi:hypothetical protein